MMDEPKQEAKEEPMEEDEGRIGLESPFTHLEDEKDDYTFEGKEEEEEEPLTPNKDNVTEFDVLDQTSDEDSHYDSMSFDSDLPDDEIEAMLEEALKDEEEEGEGGEASLQEGCPMKRMKKENSTEGEGTDKTGEKKNAAADDGTEPTEESEILKKIENSEDMRQIDKVVLEDLGRSNHFDFLPEGWVEVSHHSGMPIYLHKQSRVVTMSKPYFLGPASARWHKIPISAIPCLQYSKLLEEKAKQEDDNLVINGLVVPNPKIETVQENQKAQLLPAEAVREYCSKLFRFKTIKVSWFRTWENRRKYIKTKKKLLQKKQTEIPTLPSGTKLITLPFFTGTDPDNTVKKEWIINPNDKSYICILHRYLQQILKAQPQYEFKELENAKAPYMAIVKINGMQYGTGMGASKKFAKTEAAKNTLQVFFPQMKDKIEDKKSEKTEEESHNISVFDEVKVTDPRVAEFCAKTTELSPHDILLTCLQRNFGKGEINIDYKVNAIRHGQNEFKMTVGKHTATVLCKNKRDGKQKASQEILQKLHPHIHTWGSLLRLYGNQRIKNMKEKKQEEQEITQLQSKALINSPNFAILNKLKAEMTKLKNEKEALKPVGKFYPSLHESLPSTSVSDLNNVDLI
ncbi:unnamed protein product [Bemisia tabaci]|uniref:DRBM domain-containing protein n=1 Tax=Bemisia tabaci TaxID=7038 RepID=A0A9P0AD29_BEMTA|nr:unnamed protein product [Bemisia tabaci]